MTVIYGKLLSVHNLICMQHFPFLLLMQYGVILDRVKNFTCFGILHRYLSILITSNDKTDVLPFEYSVSIFVLFRNFCRLYYYQLNILSIVFVSLVVRIYPHAIDKHTPFFRAFSSMNVTHYIGCGAVQLKLQNYDNFNKKSCGKII